MVGDTIAELFNADDRGTAMNVFALMTFVGQVRRLCPIRSGTADNNFPIGGRRGDHGLDRAVLEYPVVLWRISSRARPFQADVTRRQWASWRSYPVSSTRSSHARHDETSSSPIGLHALARRPG